MAFVRDRVGTGFVAVIPADGSGAARPLARLDRQVQEVTWSPDGRWLAYVSNETSQAQVYVQSFPPGHGKYQVSKDGGRLARWRRDGKELVFVNGNGNVSFYSAAVRARGTELDVDAPVKLFETGMSERAGGGYFALSPDGQRIALNLAGRTQGRPLTVMADWMAGLTR